MWINYVIGAAVLIPFAILFVRGIIKLKQGRAGCSCSGCSECGKECPSNREGANRQ